jgi:hypothetical protein
VSQAGRVNIHCITTGEFDLAVSVWLIDPEDSETEIDAIFDTDSVEDAVLWCAQNCYEVVQCD